MTLVRCPSKLNFRAIDECLLIIVCLKFPIWWTSQRIFMRSCDFIARGVTTHHITTWYCPMLYLAVLPSITYDIWKRLNQVNCIKFTFNYIKRSDYSITQQQLLKKESGTNSHQPHSLQEWSRIHTSPMSVHLLLFSHWKHRVNTNRLVIAK